MCRRQNGDAAGDSGCIAEIANTRVVPGGITRRGPRDGDGGACWDRHIDLVRHRISGNRMGPTSRLVPKLRCELNRLIQSVSR